MKTYTVIVTFNGMKWINETILSVINSSKVVVVDNNSADNTVTFIKKNFPSVKIFKETVNHGFGVANNIGISYALKDKADAVFLLNQDAFIEKNCLVKLKNNATENKDYGILSPLHLNGNGREVDYNFLKITSPYRAGKLISDLILNDFRKDIYEISFINAAAWYIPKEVFLKVGGFDPLFFLYGEDDNYCQRVLYHGFKIGIIPTAKIFHDSDNNNVEFGEKGGKKYFAQVRNRMLVKYADVNKENFKKLKKYKFFILRHAFKKILSLNFFEAKVLFKKYNLIDDKAIYSSVLRNRKKSANYLSL